ncbi:hypothetical protein [Bacillus tuaregi]|uniref:hypothetical protein n=1 Tax=Bacillus tuaregi TaxID=1816695 RepID=UPI0008F83510|nr:hypothetical protein [Bacillus tuaregi]
MSTIKSNQKKFKKVISNINQLESEIKQLFTHPAYNPYVERVSHLLSFIRKSLIHHVPIQDKSSIVKDLYAISHMDEVELNVTALLGSRIAVDGKARHIIRLILQIYKEYDNALLHLNTDFDGEFEGMLDDIRKVIVEMSKPRKNIG